MANKAQELIREGAKIIFESRGIDVPEKVLDRILNVIETGVPEPPESVSGWIKGEAFERVDQMRLMAEARLEELHEDVQARDEAFSFVTKRLQQQIRLGRRQIEDSDEEEQQELVQARVEALEETLVGIAVEKSRAGIDLEE